jgi:hypothetical protein
MSRASYLIPRETDNSCENTPIDFTCCAPTTHCGTQRCPPKTRINSCINLKYGMNEISFLLSNWSCAPEVIPAHLHCWVVAIRPRGQCLVRARMKPYRAEVDGRAWFKLPEQFWRLGDGTYEFDFYMDDKLVLTTCASVVGVRPFLAEVGYADPFVVCTPPACAPTIDELPFDGSTLLAGDCDAEC